MALVVVEPGLVALEDRVWAVAAVPAYGNLVVRPAVAEVAGRAVPAAVEAGALAAGQEPVGGLEPAVEAAQVGVAAQVEVLAVEAEVLVVGLDRVAGLELVEAEALVVGLDRVAGLELVEAGALVVGLDRVAGLELVEAEALAVGQEPVAGLEPAVEAAQVGVVAQVEVLVA